jgi:hypothetical protein
MFFSNMNVKQFIHYIIDNDYNNVDDILNNCKTQAEKGFIFEKIVDIVIKFGFCNLFSNSNFNHLIGNSNNGKLKILDNINDYLNENVISGNSSGCSDITLQNKSDNLYIFISSKYPKSIEDIKKQKSIKYYDIQNIIAMATKNKHIYINYKIYLVVPDKNKVLDKVKKSNKSSLYITDHMTKDNILDKNDLNKYFILFKKDITKNKANDWQSIYLNDKSRLVLRFHQELITNKTSDLINNGNKSFLWGCKCRSGKTYMIGGIILKQLEILKKLNVLIITPAPTETAPQFTNDLFNKYKDFDKFKIFHIEGSNMLDNIDLNINNNNIIVISKQLLQRYINDKTIIKIKNLKLDIIGFDENHFTGTTDLSKDILKSYSTKNTIKIYLTATYNKPLKEWNIIEECKMFWDIEDEQICKSILIDNNNLDKLKTKHGNDYITNTILYYTDMGLSINDIFKCYEKMPELYIMTNLFDQERYEKIKMNLNKNNNKNKLGFCFETLFGLNKQKTRFANDGDVTNILKYISGSCRDEVDDYQKTIFTRINYLCAEKNTRNPFTQIWFLPITNINEISICLKKKMLEDTVLKQYDILCINCKNKELAADIKDEINKKEIEAKNKGKVGLILLAGNMLTLGITLNLCDLVILMNNTLSSDKVLQQIYRCMTEGENKKMGFVVDLNISRVLNTCINYNYSNKMGINHNDKINYLIKNNIINIDMDLLLNKQINTDIIIKKLMDIWKDDPVNNFRNFVRKLDNDYEDYDNDTQKLLNKTFSKISKDKPLNIELVFKDENDVLQELPTGKEIIKLTVEEDSKTEDSKSEDVIDSEKKENEKNVSLNKDVLPYIIPLSCILTIKNKNLDFVKMLNDIKNNPELLDVFEDQCLIWWNKKNLIGLISDLVSKKYDNNSNIYNLSIYLKLSLQSLINYPRELLNLIAESLQPRDIEKKQYGEVFTPMNIIDEMLDNLPKELWNDKNIKWFDPATGMGNFVIAIYLRLIDGLKDEIKDENQRKQHILENMLYASELNKKNIIIYKQIFNLNNDYKINIYEGDTLKMNIKTKFNIDKFDIIVGNPPYNKGGIKSFTGTKLGDANETIWPKFVDFALNNLKKDGYLVFINPLSWLKLSHSLHNILLEKHITWIELWDDSKSKSCINADIPLSLYILHNTININKLKTIINSSLNRQHLHINSNEYLSPKYSIPLAYHSIFNKLIIFIEKYNLNLEFNTHTIKSTGEKIKIPLIYTIEDMLAVDTYKIKEGIMIKKTTEKHFDACKKKIIIANKRCFEGAFIDNGKLGLTGNHKTYILGNNLELILKILNFKLSNIIVNNIKYGQSFLDNDSFKFIPDIRKINIDNIDELEFYKLIGLTYEEVNSFDSKIDKIYYENINIDGLININNLNIQKPKIKLIFQNKN